MSKTQSKSDVPPPYSDEPPRLDSSSAISLSNDLSEQSFSAPPRYTDADDTPPTSPVVSAPLLTHPYGHIDAHTFTHTYRDGSTSQRTLEPRLSEIPEVLVDFIQTQAQVPPQPVIRIRGTHSVKREDSGRDANRKNGSSKEEIVDFDLQIDFTPYIMRKSVNADEEEWRELTVAQDRQKVYTGGWRKAVVPLRSDEEGGVSDRTLEDWVKAYCVDKAPLKTFVMERRIGFLESDLIKCALGDLIRQTLNYRGNLNITLETLNKAVEIWSPHLINKWRNNWVQWVFYLSFLWIFTWPILFFMTRRYEVSVTTWPFARDQEVPGPDGRKVYRREFAVVSEENWVRRYSPAIKNAVLGRRQGWMTEEDLLRSEAEWASMERCQGAGGLINNALRGVLGVESDLRVLRGWGADEY
ncbi:MAG: hypothetical protein M1814_004961 [Vezdaea aestivalis]|nr:MAG: hypothetical protein M1814_004961 [Vezdaea aestivalis]